MVSRAGARAGRRRPRARSHARQPRQLLALARRRSGGGARTAARVPGGCGPRRRAADRAEAPSFGGRGRGRARGGARRNLRRGDRLRKRAGACGHGGGLRAGVLRRSRVPRIRSRACRLARSGRRNRAQHDRGDAGAFRCRARGSLRRRGALDPRTFLRSGTGSRGALSRGVRGSLAAGAAGMGTRPAILRASRCAATDSFSISLRACSPRPVPRASHATIWSTLRSAHVCTPGIYFRTGAATTAGIGRSSAERDRFPPHASRSAARHARLRSSRRRDRGVDRPRDLGSRGSCARRRRRRCGLARAQDRASASLPGRRQEDESLRRGGGRCGSPGFAIHAARRCAQGSQTVVRKGRRPGSRRPAAGAIAAGDRSGRRACGDWALSRDDGGRAGERRTGDDRARLGGGPRLRRNRAMHRAFSPPAAHSWIPIRHCARSHSRSRPRRIAAAIF